MTISESLARWNYEILKDISLEQRLLFEFSRTVNAADVTFTAQDILKLIKEKYPENFI